MSLEQIKPKEILDEWIPAKELRTYRRLYFSRDRLYVIKAPNDRMRFYLTIEIVALFFILGAVLNDSIRISVLYLGVLLSFLCGTILIAIALVVLITFFIWSLDNKIIRLSPQEILDLNQVNYTIDYNNISKIEFNELPKEFLGKYGELIIVTSMGTHILKVQDIYFDEIRKTIRKIPIKNPDSPKNRKKLSIKKETPLETIEKEDN